MATFCRAGSMRVRATLRAKAGSNQFAMSVQHTQCRARERWDSQPLPFEGQLALTDLFVTRRRDPRSRDDKGLIQFDPSRAGACANAVAPRCKCRCTSPARRSILPRTARARATRTEQGRMDMAGNHSSSDIDRRTVLSAGVGAAATLAAPPRRRRRLSLIHI